MILAPHHTVPKASTDAKCAHAFRFITAITSTLKVYQCTRCGEIKSVEISC